MQCDGCACNDRALYRVNLKGEKGIFKCIFCLTPEQIEEHKDLFDLCENILSGDTPQ